MKKKFKLWATIASLALAVCIMAVGVYAAASVSLNVTSTVTFNAQSVFVGYKGKIERATSAEFSSPETLVEEHEDWVTNGSTTSTSSGTLTAWTPSEVSFEEGKQFIRYTITFQNNSGFNIKVTPSSVPTTQSGVTITENNKALASIAPDATATWTLTLGLTDVTGSVNIQVNPVFTITQAA